jgi:hypothetical protein
VRWLDLAGMQHLKQSEVVTVGDFFSQKSYCYTTYFSRKGAAYFLEKHIEKKWSQTGPRPVGLPVLDLSSFMP